MTSSKIRWNSPSHVSWLRKSLAFDKSVLFYFYFCRGGKRGKEGSWALPDDQAITYRKLFRRYTKILIWNPHGISTEIDEYHTGDCQLRWATSKPTRDRVGIWKLLNIPGSEVCKNHIWSSIKKEVYAS